MGTYMPVPTHAAVSPEQNLDVDDTSQRWKRVLCHSYLVLMHVFMQYTFSFRLVIPK